MVPFLLFGLPRLIIGSIVRKVTLMVWWTGVWANQGELATNTHLRIKP